MAVLWRGNVSELPAPASSVGTCECVAAPSLPHTGITTDGVKLTAAAVQQIPGQAHKPLPE